MNSAKPESFRIGGGHTPHKVYGLIWLAIAATLFALFLPSLFSEVEYVLDAVPSFYISLALGLMGFVALAIALVNFTTPTQLPVLYVLTNEGIGIPGQGLLGWKEISSIERRGDLYIFTGRLITTDPILIRPADSGDRQSEFHAFLKAHAPADLIKML